METAALCKPIQRSADLLRIPGTWVLTGLGKLLAVLGSFPQFRTASTTASHTSLWRFLECQSIEATLTQNGHLTHHEIPSVASLRPGGHFPRIGWPVSPEYADTVPAAVLAIQTYGDQLNFHPHLHSLVAEGGWGRDDGTFQSVSWLDSDILSAIFRQQVLEMMVHTGRVTTRDSASTKALNSSYQGESASSSICGSYQADSSASSARVLPLSLDRATLHAEQHASQHQRPCEVHRGLR